MRLTLKQFFVRILLGFLRGLIFLKRHLGPVWRGLSRPLAQAGRFVLRTVGVPLFRVVLLVRRQVAQLVLPAKNRFLYLVSNRYVVHLAVICVAGFSAAAGLNYGSVRAETASSGSILYSLLSQDAGEEIEVVSASDESDYRLVSYTEDPLLALQGGHVDFHSPSDPYVTTSTGTSPATDAGAPVVPSRSEVITYTVEDGDTLSGIAAKHGLTLSTVLWANNLTLRSTIKPNQTLTIPPVDGVLYTVKQGDTISKIAKTLSADAEEIIRFNRLASADDIRIGEKLVIPGGENPAPAAPARTAPVSSIFGQAPAGTTAKPKGSAAGKGDWVWPTDWRVITQYYGWKHTGVDIDGDYNTHSYAAADGAVIYSGWRNGYGYTVEVDHGNGIVTRYAHHSKLYVKVGDVVKAGQLLAQTGTTGHSTGTHLHFEVIKNGKFQNPLDWVR
jgi:murein DD-endopeptidase MepM/ murein hydrolase activator NlpD